MIAGLPDQRPRLLQVPLGLGVFAGGDVKPRPLEVDVAEEEPHSAALGDLLGLVEVGGPLGVGDWKAAETGLDTLLGRRGRTLTTLRPAGLAEFDDQRIDVVADSEFLAAGVTVEVCEVEGNRVVVEAVEDRDRLGS